MDNDQCHIILAHVMFFRHIAAMLGKDSVVRKLLRCEANLGVKNKQLEAPITFISPSVLEEFLDDCLQDYGLMTDDNLLMTDDD